MKTKIIKLNLLSACVVLAQQSYALEILQDQDLGQVTGQDGITITHEVSKVDIKELNWFDPNSQTNVQMGLGLHNVKIDGINQKNITSEVSIDVGQTSKGAGMLISASVDPFVASADLNIVEKPCSASACHAINRNASKITSLGKIGIETSSAMKLVLETQAGLFNSKDVAYIDFQLQNANISHGIGNNKTLLKDFNFNFAGFGYMYINELEGVVLSTYNTAIKPGMSETKNIVHLGRVTDTTDVAVGRNKPENPGVNLDLRYVTQKDENSPEVARNLIRMGASGDITNAKLSLNSDQSQITQFNVKTKQPHALSSYDDITTTGGLHLGLSADFTDENTKLTHATTFELGHTGRGSYAIEFSGLRSLTGKENAYINFGNIYVNTLQGKSLEFLIDENLRGVLRQDDNLRHQNLAVNKNYALIAVRGFDFQSIASKARFISDNSIAAINDDTSSWGIGIPVHNLNANLALTGTIYDDNKQGMAYDLIASTTGYGVDKISGLGRTTSLILIDGQIVNGEAVNYYAGLRNIDALIQSNGIIGYEDEGILIRANHLMLAAQAELAIGQLPGSKYNCTKANVSLCGQRVADDNFAKPWDVLTTIALKVDGQGELWIIPGLEPTAEQVGTKDDKNYLGFRGHFDFTQLTDDEKKDDTHIGSYLSLTNKDINSEGDVIQTSAISFNQLQGELGFEGQVKMKKDTVSLNTRVDLNRNKDLANPFRTNFAMTTNGKMQNIASIALTGGNIRSDLGIKPR